MSTIQHTSQPAIRTRLALVVVFAAAVAAVTVALIVSGNSSSTSVRLGAPGQPQPALSPSEIDQQLESVAGPRYGLARPAPGAPTKAQLDRQLQAVAGARFGQPVGIYSRP
jgi:hypothetical protein